MQMRNRPNPIRGISRGEIPFAVRADAGAPTQAQIMATLENLQTTFQAFRAKNDERLAEIARGRDDVVTREHTDRINAQVTELDQQMRAMNERLARAALSSSMDTASRTPQEREHATAFVNFVRRGVEGNLNQLAIQATLQTDSNTDGGYTVPAELDRQIGRVAAQRNGFRAVAGKQTIGGDTLEKLHSIGGATSGWTTERGSRTQTNTPQLVKIAISAEEMYAMPYATQKMLDDSFINVESWLADEVGIAMADLEGAAFITGTGVNQPRGMHSHTFAASTVASPSAWERVGYTLSGASGDFASSNPADKIIDLVYSIKPLYRTGSSFLTSDDTAAKIRKMKDGQGNYLVEPKISSMGGGFMLMGYDMVLDDNMPVVAANSYSLGFGDWGRFYTIVDRMGTRVLRDAYSAKPYIQFYTTKRVGGGVTDFHAAKFMKFAAS